MEMRLSKYGNGGFSVAAKVDTEMINCTYMAMCLFTNVSEACQHTITMYGLYIFLTWH